MRSLKPGSKVIVRSGNILAGVNAVLVRVSKRTSECIIRLSDSRGAYKAGSIVQVKRWEIE